MRVLVAEHEPVWQDFLCSALRTRGFHPILSADGESAIAILEGKDAPRLAFIDRCLPRINGVEVCRQLRSLHDSFYTYVILMVPNSYRVEELVGLESGADDCLAKPFSAEEISVRINIAKRILDVEARLTEINGHWRTLLDHLPFGVASVDQNGILKRMNTAFAIQMGYRHSRELLGMPVSQVLRKRIDVDALLEQIQWREPFDNVNVQCRCTSLKSGSVRLWGRPLPPDQEAVYELVVLNSL